MPSKTIDISDAQDSWPELLSLVESGTEIILTEADRPRARLVPLATPKERKAGLHPGNMEATEEFDDPLPEDFWFGAK